MTSPNLPDHFSTLEDPRQSAKIVCPLPEILLAVLCGVLAGADDLVEIERWARRRIDVLRRILPFKMGICSHDTLNDVMNALPGELFAQCFSRWVSTLGDHDPEIVAIDGKTSRRAHGVDGRALHLVSAWASRQGLVLGQEACDGKENEISATPRLLERLELTGALVTMDAMGCRHGIGDAIPASGADYLLALKGNRKSLHDEVARFFDVARDLDTRTTTDADHGRIERRTASVCHAVDWLSAGRKAPGEPRLAGLTTIAMAEAEVETRGKITRSRRFHIASAQLTAGQVLFATRAHWGIENRLHWVMDVVFHDDLMRLRTQDGPQDMALIRHTALDIIKQTPDRASMRVRRKTAAWDDQYLFDAIMNQS